ncbi:DNA binding protein [Mycobacterium phage InvictusManeo]|nr:DNA binding protein [Mycobacterium phage InvictusManeo]
MSKKQPTEELTRMLNDAAMMAEVDAEIMGDHVDLTDVKVTRGGPRTRVLQIRLNDDELAELERRAGDRDLPASTVAREILLRALFPRPAASPLAFARDDAAEAFLQFIDSVVERQLAARMGTG